MAVVAFRAFVALMILNGPGLTAEWPMRLGDRIFTKEELCLFIATNQIRFHDGGRSEYGPGDAYSYVYASENRANGAFRIETDRSICVDFVNGFSRCDLFVRNGNRVILIDEKGDRYPLR